MWFSSSLRNRLRSNPGVRPRSRLATPQRATFRPLLEALEDRWLPSQIGLTVSSLADSGPATLRAAIQTADAGRPSDQFTIGFAVNGTIDLLSPLPDLNNSIAIQGPGMSSLTVERAAGASFASAIVTVDAGQTASVSGLTVANGNDGGIANNGMLTVSGCAVSGNTAVVGGGIVNNQFATLEVNGCSLTANSAGFGGGIDNLGALTVKGSTLSGNSAGEQGGGIFGGNLRVSGCLISNNSAGVAGSVFGFGGGVSMDSGTVTNTTFTGNVADAGAGMSTSVASTSTVSGCTLSGNVARFIGGGIYNHGLTLTVSGCTLANNSATGEVLDGFALAAAGGAIFNQGFVTVSGSTLSGNSAIGLSLDGLFYPGKGGAIDSLGATTIRDSLFSQNSADVGGAIYNYFTAPLGVRGSSFSGNTASDSGGGIYNLGAATVQASTLSGNIAGTAGGGIYNGAPGTLSVKDSTVLNNVAPIGADIYNLGVLTLDESTVGVIGP